ncbi:hypothetical protein [Streptomyces sp. JL7001]|uniref:hypothetical protein n=1 Tax=Streptomyces sp. JL7001 TaxID=3445784 RepID=UPI003F7975C0
MRALHVLAPAAMTVGPVPTTPGPTAPQAAALAPVERRTPPEGYHRAIEAHRQAALRSRVDPHIAEAVERQNWTMRELSRRAFPETDVVADDAPAPIDQARVQRRREAAVTGTGAGPDRESVRPRVRAPGCVS